MQELLKCIHCDLTPLTASDSRLKCGGCGAEFPIRLGVPLLGEGITWRPAETSVDDEMIRAACELTGAEPTPANTSAMREILSWCYDFPQVGLSAENNYFLERVATTLRLLGRADRSPPANQNTRRLPGASSATPSSVNENIAFSLDLDYLPDRLPAGRVSTHNIRITNTGSGIISSEGSEPVHLSYHWLNQHGAVIDWDGRRTPLPVELRPGCSVTVPLSVAAPMTRGPAFVQVCLVHEGRQWNSSDTLLPVEIERSTRGAALPKHWQTLNSGNENYFDDHEAAKQMLDAEVEKRGSGLRLLELWASSCPILASVNAEVYCVDVDVQSVQIAAFKNKHIHPVVADANRMPFVEGVFDGIAMFATLHHFAEPAKVLRSLKGLLKPDGFLAVMCEPCGHLVAPYPEHYVRELEQGINEQAFSLEEYEMIFEQAGLEAFELVNHRGSCKAFLRATAELPADALRMRARTAA
jgi:SAM-dependent methyltransferase